MERSDNEEKRSFFESAEKENIKNEKPSKPCVLGAYFYAFYDGFGAKELAEADTDIEELLAPDERYKGIFEE